jgi:hypothetical protein
MLLGVCGSGQAAVKKDLPPPDRVLLEEAGLFLAFSRGVTKSDKTLHLIHFANQFLKDHTALRRQMIAEFPDLYIPGTPSIAYQADPAVTQIYSISTELFQYSLLTFQKYTEERQSADLSSAFQELRLWLETGKQVTDKTEDSEQVPPGGRGEAPRP